MTTEQMNRAVCQWIGILWHEYLPCSDEEYNATNVAWRCTCGRVGHHNDENPDFSQGAGIIRLLEEMMKHREWVVFGGVLATTFRGDHHILTDYVTTNGKLLQAVYEWAKKYPR